MKQYTKSHTTETKIAKRFATENGCYGIRFLCYSKDCCVFETVFPPGLLVDPAWPPTYIIVDDLLEVRWSTEEESESIWEQEQMFGKS